VDPVVEPELEELLVPDVTRWRHWLLAHHDDVHGVWLVLNKRGDEVTALTYPAAVEKRSTR